MKQAHAAAILMYAWIMVSVSHKRVLNWSPEAAVRIKLGKAQSVRSTVLMVSLSLSNRRTLPYIYAFAMARS